jgi:hypothetical protein
MKKYIIALLIIVILCGTGYYYYVDYSEKKLSTIFLNSFIKQRPEDLQNLLVNDIQDGKNDETTKAAMYWITHRFFDNKGDINEIYDFVNSHPETAFLREAESIYPEIFEKIKNKELEIGNNLHNIDATLAYLAYLKVIESSGYADIATLATLANKSIELTHRLTKFKNPTNVLEEYHFKYIEAQKEMSPGYASKTQAIIDMYLKNEKRTLSKVEARDMLVGLNQYAQTLVYYKFLGIEYASTYTYESLFQESMAFAWQNVPELYHYSVFLYLASLVTLNEITAEKAFPLLGTILTRRIETSPSSSPVYRIIHCDKERATYSCENIKLYAELDPRFKVWLEANGWKPN